MDYSNDAIGRDIAKKAKSKEEIVEMAKEAIDTGKAKTIKDTTGPYY
jgi:predicted RNase H-like HicB family nuclease